jgi:ABC-type multidrug transport system ATPase subunit
MKIELQNAGKRFNRDWIFKQLQLVIHSKERVAITGPNGTGKSTLLQIIGGSVTLNEGKIEWTLNEKTISEETIFEQIAIVAPYLELIEEYTAKEFLRFHSQFKPLQKGIQIVDILDIIGLRTAADKQIRFYSSGMKQRLKLAQAIFTDVPLLLLDEPCTNLDVEGYALYHSLIKDHCADKTIVVSSNDVNEYDFCERKISITDFKPTLSPARY